MKRLRAALLFLAILLLLALAVRWVRHELAIDRCVDRGGHWNAVSAICEGTHRAGAGALLARGGLL
ncbi:MAG: hypothetical protein M3Y65_25070 [Pseudomonadota bacterium]|nr:hypothetical protein [Pseudomonadota bacterium]